MKNNPWLSAILLGTMGLLFGPFSKVTMPHGPEELPQKLASVQHSHIIPFELYKNFVFIPVNINGSKPYHFVLDTGANVSFLNETLANGLNIEIKHHHESSIGTGETSTRLGFAKGVLLGLDGIDVPASRVAVVPLADIESSVGRQIDGILGADLFKRWVVTIDYAARTVTLDDPHDYAYHGNGDLIPLRMSGDRAFIKAIVTPVGSDSMEGQFVIDTGDHLALGLHTPFVEKYKLRSTQKMIPHLSQGLSGESRNWWGRIVRFQLGKLAIDSPITTFAEATKGSDADRSYDGVLGGEILRRFKVTLDYSRHQMILEPNTAFAETYDFDMSGLSLAAQGANFATIKVRHVQDDSPASEAGLKEGDILETIDSRPAAGLGLQQIGEIFKKDGQEYLLGVKHNDSLVHLILRTRRLI